MNIFDRFRNRDVEVPELQVGQGEARLADEPNGGVQERQAPKPEDDPRRFAIPGKTWAAFTL